MRLFGKILKELRIKNKLSQKDVAKALYLSNSSISHYENDRCKPSRDTIEAVARYFDVSIDYLLGTSHICDVEELMQNEYYESISIYELVMKCLKIADKDRGTLLTIINALEQDKK